MFNFTETKRSIFCKNADTLTPYFETHLTLSISPLTSLNKMVDPNPMHVSTKFEEFSNSGRVAFQPGCGCWMCTPTYTNHCLLVHLITIELPISHNV